MTIVVYSCDDEVLVTTKENESVMVREWFDEGKRDVDDYDIEEYDVFQITTRIDVDGYNNNKK